MPKPTQTTGKQGELKVIGELLRKGFDVYLPVVDIQGIDCVLRTKKGYREVQIKTRENVAGGLLFDAQPFKPRDNYFVICYYMEEPNNFWVFPSKVYYDNARKLPGKNPKLRLYLGKEMQRRLWDYRDKFQLLSD